MGSNAAQVTRIVSLHFAIGVGLWWSWGFGEAMLMRV